MRYIQLSSIENDYNKINKKLYKDEQLNVKERDIDRRRGHRKRMSHMK